MASEKLAGPKFRKASVVNDLAELVSNSRLIILATPIGALAESASALSELVTSDHVVSDVASVKRPVAEVARGQRCEIAANMFLRTRWPVRKSPGAEAARDDLFAGAVTLLCPELAGEAASVPLRHGILGKARYARRSGERRGA